MRYSVLTLAHSRGLSSYITCMSTLELNRVLNYKFLLNKSRCSMCSRIYVPPQSLTRVIPYLAHLGICGVANQNSVYILFIVCVNFVFLSQISSIKEIIN